MAFTSSTVFEIRTTGNDTNSGGFNSAGSSPGVDRTQQDSPHMIIDGTTITATVHTTTTQITLTGYTVSADDRRNTVNIIAGGTSAVTGFYEITAVDIPNNRWTMSSAMGTAGQTVHGRMGGAWATLTNRASISVSPTVWIKSGTYTFSGISTFPGSSTIRGYTTTRGDYSTRPVLQLTGNRTTSWFTQSNILNLICDLNGFNQTSNQVSNQTNTGFLVDVINGGAGTNVNLIDVWGGFSRIFRCYVENTTSDGYRNNAGGMFNCVARNCGNGYRGDANDRGYFFNCIAISCTTRGFNMSGGGLAEAGLINCMAINCGIGFYTGGQAMFVRCLASGSTTYGFSQGNANQFMSMLFNCAAYNSGTGNVNGSFGINVGFVNLTNDPFTDQGTEDFSYNNVAGGGANIKDILSFYPDLPNTSVYDIIGPMYPEISGGGGGSVGLVGGILGS